MMARAEGVHDDETAEPTGASKRIVRDQGAARAAETNDALSVCAHCEVLESAARSRTRTTDDRREDNAMSDSLEKLALEMLNQSRQWRELYKNQQELITGLNALLQNHSQALAMHQRVIEVLCRETGIAFASDDPPAPSGAPN